ncbi:MAG: Fic family protein [Egibacteraceae bacterium]
MTYILQVADDPYLEINTSLIRSLHFMILKYDLDKRPGRWRAGPIYVRNEDTGQNVYEGPDVTLVPGLMEELTLSIKEQETLSPEVRGAMAHLNLTMIHPFRDGNGRMARALQTLLISRNEIIVPEFCSIEEYLGRNTPAYYAVLSEVGEGKWQPQRSARPWLRFCLTAHVRQAHRLLRRVRETSQLWDLVEDEVRRRGLPDRMIEPLWSAASGIRLRNVSYRRLAEVSDQTASRDLRALVEAELLEPRGEKRGRFYLATRALRGLREATRQSVRVDEHVDPYR